MEWYWKAFCAGNWPPARGHDGDLIAASRTYAKRTWGPWTWTLRSEKRRCQWSFTLIYAIYTKERGEKKRKFATGDNHAQRKENNAATLGETVFTWIRCNWNCHYSVGLYSHKMYCAAMQLKHNFLGAGPWGLEIDGCHIYDMCVWVLSTLR